MVFTYHNFWTWVPKKPLKVWQASPLLAMQKHNSKYNFNILGGNGDKNQGSHSMCGSTALTVPFNFSFCDLLISCELEDIIGTNIFSVTWPKKLEGWGQGQFGKCPKKAAPRTEQTWLGSTSFGTQQLTIRVDRNWKTSGWQDILLTTGRSSGSKENKETQLLLLQNGEWPAFQSFSDHQLLLLLISPGTNILSNRLQQPIDTVIGLWKWDEKSGLTNWTSSHRADKKPLVFWAPYSWFQIIFFSQKEI